MGELTVEELIALKRDRGEHSAGQIDRLVLGYTRDEIPDYQMSAWLMAACINGLSDAETVAMTDAMVRSGRVMDLSSVDGVKVDKHSTGGVADTTTLVLAPLVAACGAPVAKMSGRGLGHTGGTLDKLESIPGFRVELSAEAFLEQVRSVGVAVIAQSPDIDPADKKIYALRDVTATVPSIPLIVGSIISKKIAGGADAILLDVKVGSGAFMKTERDARALARALESTGRALGKQVVCVMTNMDQPLGRAIGNSLEVVEAIETLSGKGPERLAELCLRFAARMLVMAGVAASVDDGAKLAGDALRSGAALERFAAWIEAQGGDPRIAHDPSLLARAAHKRDVRVEAKGYVAGFDTEEIGRAAMVLGAGRSAPGEAIDHAAGIVVALNVGDQVAAGDLAATLHASDPALLDLAEERLRRAWRLSETPTDPPPLYHDV